MNLTNTQQRSSQSFLTPEQVIVDSEDVEMIWKTI